MVDRHIALDREDILAALTAYTGMTTADGATPANNTLVDSFLIGANDFITGKTILIGAGYNTSFEDKVASSFNPVTGAITVSAGFSAQIKQGTIYRILNVTSPGALATLLNAIDAKVSRIKPYVDPPWSAYLTQLQLSTVPGNPALPSVTMTGLPSGATISLAVMRLKVRTIENTNALVNSVSGAQNIEVQKAVGGAWITAMALGGGEFSVPATTRENGDVFMGTNDISAQIPANGAVINFRWALALSAQNNLNFNDIQMGVRVWYTL